MTRQTIGFLRIGKSQHQPDSSYFFQIAQTFLPEIPKSPLDFTDSLHHTPPNQLLGRFVAVDSMRGWRVVLCSRNLRFE